MWRENWEQNKGTDGHEQPLRQKLTWTDFINALPDTLPEAINLWITGGLTRNGFTYNDIDWCMADKETFAEAVHYKGCLYQLARELFDRSSHVGNKVHDYYPVPILVQIYQDGNLLDRETLLSAVVERDEEERIPSQRGYDHRITKGIDDFYREIKDIKKRIDNLEK